MSPASTAARRRATWPVRVRRLGEEQPDDLVTRTTAAERLAMVEEISVTAYGLAGLPALRPPRAAWPVRKTTLDETDGRGR